VESLIGMKSDWRSVAALDDALKLVDIGVVLKWRDVRALRKTLSSEDQLALLRHFVNRLCERADDRLSAEITVESILIWMANGESEQLVNEFINELLQNPLCEEASRALVEIALTSEVVENTHDEDIFSMAVALICELGLSLQAHERSFPGDIEDVRGILDHITTYLLSVSNSSNTCIRLSLLHYFGEQINPEGLNESFNRIVGRFGHTVLDHLFTLLFNKKSEAIALQFLLENLPAMLITNSHGQYIVHETLKYYMLKHPERFGLFVQVFSDHITRNEKFAGAILANTLRHIGVLMRVASSVNHKPLALELSTAVMKFDATERNRMLDEILVEMDLRKPIRNLLVHLREGKNPDKIPDSISQFRTNKRGRRPSFSRADMASLSQISYLGSPELLKAG
jgi:hypothetical protein